MKRRMLTKLISAVCTLALTTSCMAMAVGASPPIEQMKQIKKEEINWEEELYVASELINDLEGLRESGYKLEDCKSLVDRIEDFFKGTACKKTVSELENKGEKITLKCEFELALKELRANNIEKRIHGFGYVVDYLSYILKMLVQHIQ